MSTPGGTADLLAFAGAFIAGIDRHQDIRTEELAETFRDWCQLPPFPSIEQIRMACLERGIALTSLPAAAPMDGLNTWAGDGGPTILVREDLVQRRAETTIGHELREVLENAFKRVKPAYQSLDTRDNRAMNPESDQFAGCLLMQGSAMRARLAETGYDFLRFSRDYHRSLASVILRAQQLFSANQLDAPVVGAIWLFEAPWDEVMAGRTGSEDMWVTFEAKLGGFSVGKAAQGARSVARHVFPAKDAKADGFALVCRAAATGRSQGSRVGGFDLFGEHDFLIVAEPITARGCPWRVLLTAMRRDCAGLLGPWFSRVGQPVADSYQSL